MGGMLNSKVSSVYYFKLIVSLSLGSLLHWLRLDMEFYKNS